MSIYTHIGLIVLETIAIGVAGYGFIRMGSTDLDVQLIGLRNMLLGLFMILVGIFVCVIPN